jgi:hypothetical protein
LFVQHPVKALRHVREKKIILINSELFNTPALGLLTDGPSGRDAVEKVERLLKFSVQPVGPSKFPAINGEAAIEGHQGTNPILIYHGGEMEPDNIVGMNTSRTTHRGGVWLILVRVREPGPRGCKVNRAPRSNNPSILQIVQQYHLPSLLIAEGVVEEGRGADSLPARPPQVGRRKEGIIET